MTNTEQPSDNSLNSLSLGKITDYKDTYSPELLQGVPRTLSREQIGLESDLPFQGVDLWNGYEVSWLNNKGKPQVAILRCWVPINSYNLIESKSFKLYLNSLNQSKFTDWQTLESTLCQDLSTCAQASVTVTLNPLNSDSNFNVYNPKGDCLDDLDIEIDTYSPNAQLLSANTSTKVEECLYSDLLKSNCLITHQPDWATLYIRYSGSKINHEGLLKYIVSFRQHNEFHEQCVERIFCDILNKCNPTKLTVYARYTRRGGLDINPFRSNFETLDVDLRLPRQ
ncbi:NADPH-dependent 7-cyano-7-deazaguanine reductase QueF [Alteromonas sp. 5E99-2]|uniref:NADPH-dependent 7-cyano-7-deazaguanine reductase QueF n=1 Tax=Alteromonas sp. 5E99-2 TaxID=2817683 RepID=UPI001A990A36|nr:NADPH-dependent 7-cyano-7-deazaguanine reductase QueF [Alteromonas sp. 5E99-2]MBO1254119.1 NADPH-dependent 7-cyano-7-deazaguanine reductase QueF [Alteromonas sp. 5E99-2]